MFLSRSQKSRKKRASLSHQAAAIFAWLFTSCIFEKMQRISFAVELSNEPTLQTSVNFWPSLSILLLFFTKFRSPTVFSSVV